MKAKKVSALRVKRGLPRVSWERWVRQPPAPSAFALKLRLDRTAVGSGDLIGVRG